MPVHGRGNTVKHFRSRIGNNSVVVAGSPKSCDIGYIRKPSESMILQPIQAIDSSGQQRPAQIHVGLVARKAYTTFGKEAQRTG